MPSPASSAGATCGSPYSPRSPRTPRTPRTPARRGKAFPAESYRTPPRPTRLRRSNAAFFDSDVDSMSPFKSPPLGKKSPVLSMKVSPKSPKKVMKAFGKKLGCKGGVSKTKGNKSSSSTAKHVMKTIGKTKNNKVIKAVKSMKAMKVMKSKVKVMKCMKTKKSHHSRHYMDVSFLSHEDQDLLDISASEGYSEWLGEQDFNTSHKVKGRRVKSEDFLPWAIDHLENKGWFVVDKDPKHGFVHMELLTRNSNRW